MSEQVLTLIAPSDKQKLTKELVSKVAAQLAYGGAVLVAADWLAEDEACDLRFTGMTAVTAEEVARQQLDMLPIDCIAQAYELRRKKLLISDMDSTIITIECIDELADFAGFKPQVAAITERAMRGEIEFTAALNERVALLKDIPVSTLQEVYDARVKFMPGARELVATMRKAGAECILVSGGFDFFTSRVRDALEFTSDSANKLEVADGKLTGRVVPPILDKHSKLATLKEAKARLHLKTDEILGVGDGANDVPMLLFSGLGVAYHAKPVVQQSARARINHCDLTALLYAQGYKKEAFISSLPSSR